MFRAAVRKLALLSVTVVLAACGGGSSGGGGSTVPSPPSSGGDSSTSTWTNGVFQPTSTFENKCSVVRTGLDIEGNPFPDRAGTLTDEKQWIRSWTHETYLWNTEVIDQNPRNSDTRTLYFNRMRTLSVTSSGKYKDQYHFSEPTAEYLARRNSAAETGYGARFVILSGSVPRDVRVAYTEPGTPAEAVVDGQKKLVRGTQILSVNGVDVVYSLSQAEIDVLNYALFPSTPGITATLVVRDPGAATTRTVTLTSQNLVEKPVNRVRVIDNGGRKTGYVLFNTFSPYSSEQDIVQAMQTLKGEGVHDLVLDLRYNGGGLLAVASQLSYMVAGDGRTTGRTFERLRFNASAGYLNPVTGQVNDPVPFYKTGLGFTVPEGTPLPSLELPRVFVLSTANTCSASEAVVNGLRGVGVEVVLIGAKTCGKPYGFYPTDNCGETYYTIQFQGVNDMGFGDYADGFVPANAPDTFGVKLPGCAVSDADYTRELGDADEGLLRAALTYGASGTCPAKITADSSLNAARISAVPSLELKAPERHIMETNRDMILPR